MNSDSDFKPYEGTSDGRVKRTSNGSTVEIKQEPDVKEEPLDQIEMVSRVVSARVDVAFETDLEVKWEVETDDEWDFEWNSVNDPDYVKEEEVKCEYRKKKEEKNSSAASDSNGRAANDSAQGNENIPLGESKDNEKKAKPKRNRNKKNENLSQDLTKPTAKYTKKHKCPKCNYVASFKSQLMRHDRTHTGEKPFCCDICSRTFTQNFHLMRHRGIHGAQFSFGCSKCCQGFDCEQEKIDHENKCKVRRFECELCKYSTQYKHHLKNHMLVHSGEKLHKCSICLKAFSQKTNLIHHLRTHRDVLPFTCSKCGQLFADDDSKQSHENHCQNRRYECYLCWYKCFSKTNLKGHMHAKHTGDTPFKCEVCHKQFSEKKNLNYHMALHRDQYPFQCSKCQRPFSNGSCKIAHETICRRRQFECYICKDYQRNKFYLQNHLKSQHSGDKPFGCEFCKARYIQKSNATAHMKHVHHSKK